MSDDLVKERMDEFEERQDQQLAILKRLEFAICGDLGIGHAGIIRTQENHSEEIISIKNDIYNIKKVDDQQKVVINAKKNQTDDWIKWGTRLGIALIVLILVSVLLTGEIGIVDLIKAAL